MNGIPASTTEHPKGRVLHEIPEFQAVAHGLLMTPLDIQFLRAFRMRKSEEGGPRPLMLILSSDEQAGSVVEKKVKLKQTRDVFSTGLPRI